MSRRRAQKALKGETGPGVARHCDLWDPDLVRALGGSGQGPAPRFRALRELGADMTRAPARHGEPLPDEPEGLRRALADLKADFDADREHAGDDALVVLAFPHAILGPALHRNGAFNLLAALASSPAEAAARLEGETSLCREAAGILASWDGLDAVLFMDDLAGNQGPLVSPDTLRALYFPRLREAVAPLCRAGIPVLFHSDGDLTSLARDILAAGFAGHHPVEPVGNWSLRSAASSENVVVVGNASLARLSASREAAAAERRRCEEFGADHAAYVMAPASEICNEIPLEHLLAFFGVTDPNP